jgi:hypothetical protein
VGVHDNAVKAVEYDAARGKALRHFDALMTVSWAFNLGLSLESDSSRLPRCLQARWSLAAGIHQSASGITDPTSASESMPSLTRYVCWLVPSWTADASLHILFELATLPDSQHDPLGLCNVRVW